MKLDRRSFVRGALMLGAASPLLLSACASGSNSSGGGADDGGTLNWLTWSDHYSTDQLAKVADTTKITGKPKLFSDNADAFLQLKQAGAQFDLVSGDALWVKKYMESGLIEPFDLASISSSSELYSMAKNFEFMNDPKGALGYPFSWSTVQIYFNPDKVKTPPTSWESLTDPMYKGLVVAENIPTDLMAIAGIATGSKTPYAQTPDQISSSSNFLGALKPNIVKLASQNNEIVTMMASGEAALCISNLGTDVRVKDAGGPELKSAYPPEGTIGFIDAEMISAQGSNKPLVKPFLDAMQKSEWIVANFTTNWRPLFNETAAKALMADPKTADNAKRLFMNDPEKALAMTLKGPAQDQQAYTEAFNQVFGA
ncbi:ABC transporter substrate-binding protein [Mycobacterium antarcticum]|uniref:ABC transporter substrate-binding protein n=1 Tax=unclassified Mycolicibacterium TaxID=2636767 RepID=UPI0024E13FEB|nr:MULTISPECIES: ABC transporter substrate-binding protein [unclassified Mycolicibacterium]